MTDVLTKPYTQNNEHEHVNENTHMDNNSKRKRKPGKHNANEHLSDKYTCIGINENTYVIINEIKLTNEHEDAHGHFNETNTQAEMNTQRKT